MEQMYNAIEKMIFIFSYFDFSKLYNVTDFFPELNQIFLKEGITFPISSISRAVQW